MKKKIVITGGSGFIGSHLVKKFLKNNYTVLNLDKLSKESQKLYIRNKNYFFKKCDLINQKKLNKILNNFKPSIIINAAAESHVDRSIDQPKYFYENNISSTLNLLEYIRQSQKKVEFIHISTDEVFGSLRLKEKKFNVNSKYDPRSPYSASKASSDHAVRAYGETFKINYSIINCSNNYGRYQYPEKLIPVIIKNCIERKPIPIYGNGKNIRDWIHVEDHVEAIFQIQQYGCKNLTFLIGSNNELQNIQIAKKICSIFDGLFDTKNSQRLIKFVKDRKGHDFRYAINNNEIYKIIGWKPLIKFDKGIEDTIKFYVENYNKLKKIFPYG